MYRYQTLVDGASAFGGDRRVSMKQQCPRPPWEEAGGSLPRFQRPIQLRGVKESTVYLLRAINGSAFERVCILITDFDKLALDARFLSAVSTFDWGQDGESDKHGVPGRGNDVQF